MKLTWSEIAFILGGTGRLVLPQGLEPLLDAITVLPAIEILRRMFTHDVKDLQARLFGWGETDLFALYGENEWRLRGHPDVLFRPLDWMRPTPAFNYRGLMSLPAVMQDRLVLERVDNSGKTEEFSGNVLLVGGTRITPEMRNFLDSQSDAPFKFVEEMQIHEQFRPATPPPTICRLFDHNGEVYERTSVTGKYLVDSRNPSDPPFGPFVNLSGQITGDVLVLTIARDSSGKRVVSVNAGYGAADRLADVMCSGDVLNILCEQLPKTGTVRMQAVFTLMVEHHDHGEEYKKPELKQIACY